MHFWIDELRASEQDGIGWDRIDAGVEGFDARRFVYMGGYM